MAGAISNANSIAGEVVMNKFHVYLVTNLHNGKKYVGITTRSVRTRWSGHLAATRFGSQQTLHRAIRKYKEDAFIVEHIADATSLEHLRDAERALIAQYATFGRKCYNSTVGGEGCFG